MFIEHHLCARLCSRSGDKGLSKREKEPCHGWSLPSGWGGAAIGQTLNTQKHISRSQRKKYDSGGRECRVERQAIAILNRLESEID